VKIRTSRAASEWRSLPACKATTRIIENGFDAQTLAVHSGPEVLRHRFDVPVISTRFWRIRTLPHFAPQSWKAKPIR